MTLIEILTVVAIFGIGTGIFYSTFMTNWRAFDDQLVRVNLWQDANEIIERLSVDARAACQMNVTTTPGSRQVTFELPDGTIVIYRINPAGGMELIRGGNTVLLSNNVDAPNSAFQETENSLWLNLTLQDNVFGRRVALNTSTQIFPRGVAR